MSAELAGPEKASVPSPDLQTTLTYRPDIDGLRAIAVLLVIAYHAGFQTWSGGFIGVDVFFVISGYLITGIVAREMAEGRFTFGRFYVRRIKRILPASYLMLVATMAGAYFVLLPAELVALAESLLAAIGFVSNFYFGAVTEGYFAPEAGTQPLLHTWSLAVEEQFYFIWPLALFLLPALLRSRRARSFLVVAAICSFGAAEIGSRSMSDVVFFSIWSRAGELLIGSLLALHESFAKRGSPALTGGGATPIDHLLGLAGFALILAPATLLSDQSIFPGIHAVWPCLGSAALIRAGKSPDSISRSVLSFRPLVAIGLLSYSLYLWHWPLFVFAGRLRIDSSGLVPWILIGLAFILAGLSWVLVERPIRRQRDLGFGQAFTLLLALPVCAIAALAIVVIRYDGMPARFDRASHAALDAIEWGPADERRACFGSSQTEPPPLEPCLLGARGQRPDVLLWGDSIANHFTGFFDEVGAARGVSLREVTMGGCPPILGVNRLERRRGALCRIRNDQVLELLDRSPEIETIILAGFWPKYLRRDGFLGDDKSMELSEANTARVVEMGFDRTLSAILGTGRRVIVVRSVPEIDFDGATCGIKNRFHPQRLARACEMRRTDRPGKHPIDEIFERLLERHPGLEVVRLDGLVCRAKKCVVELEGIPIYLRGNRSHLNMMGSRALGRAYLDRFGAGGPLF